MAFGQNRHGRVITMQAIGGQDMGFETPAQRSQRRAARTHGIGHGREADRNTFTRVTLGLAVERLMLAKLLEQDHRQQARPRPTTRNDVERRGCLADLLAILAGEFLPHGLDHLPLARDRFQSLGDVLAHFTKPFATATTTSRRRRDDHTLAGQMVRKGISFGALAGKSRNRRNRGCGNFSGQLIFGGTCFQLFERKGQLFDQQR
jgi:hypothetical protein